MTVSRIAGVGLALAAALVLGAPVAGAAPGSTTLSGTVTLRGSGGKDEFSVRMQSAANSTIRMTIVPSVSVSATSGSCPPETDPLTGRPTRNECSVTRSSSLAVVIDLLAGDDAVAVDDPGLVPAMRANGGPGNDQITLEAPSTPRTLNGDDGDDFLFAPGEMSDIPTDNRPVTYNGGGGVDTAHLGAAFVDTGAIAEVGANASLVAKTAVFAGRGPNGDPITFRTDTLDAIETLSGSEVGDLLTGASPRTPCSATVATTTSTAATAPTRSSVATASTTCQGTRVPTASMAARASTCLPAGAGGDTFNTRDGFAEQITCVRPYVIVDDLVDRVLDNTSTRACSVTTAAAKHLHDTKLSGRPAKLDDGAW